jgi:hypothetical protein
MVTEGVKKVLCPGLLLGRPLPEQSAFDAQSESSNCRSVSCDSCVSSDSRSVSCDSCVVLGTPKERQNSGSIVSEYSTTSVGSSAAVRSIVSFRSSSSGSSSSDSSHHFGLPSHLQYSGMRAAYKQPNNEDRNRTEREKDEIHAQKLRDSCSHYENYIGWEPTTNSAVLRMPAVRDRARQIYHATPGKIKKVKVSTCQHLCDDRKGDCKWREKTCSNTREI